MKITAHSITHEQIRALRAEAIEECDVAQIAICDAAFDWATFEPHEYVLTPREVRELPRSQVEAVQACVDAINMADSHDDPHAIARLAMHESLPRT